jgi:hypothetical protein
LQKQIPGFITVEAYRLLWENAHATFSAFTTLNRRRTPIDQKVADYERVFQSLYDGVNVAHSRIVTTQTGPQGVASMLAASQAMLLYVETAYAAAAIETALPTKERWAHDRAQKFEEIADGLISTMTVISEKRISEATQEQALLATEALGDLRSPPWRELWDQLFSYAKNRSAESGDGNHSTELGSCFKSRILADGVYLSLHHQDVSVTYQSHVIGNQVLAISDVKLSLLTGSLPGWSRRWGSLVGGPYKGKWTGLYDRAAYLAKVNWYPNRGKMPLPEEVKKRNHTLEDDACFLYDQPFPPLGVPGWSGQSDIWTTAYFKPLGHDAVPFGATVDRHATAVLNQQILRRCNSVCSSLSSECRSFKDSIAARAAKDRSPFERLWDYLT